MYWKCLQAARLRRSTCSKDSQSWIQEWKRDCKGYQGKFGCACWREGYRETWRFLTTKTTRELEKWQTGNFRGQVRSIYTSKARNFTPQFAPKASGSILRWWVPAGQGYGCLIWELTRYDQAFNSKVGGWGAPEINLIMMVGRTKHENCLFAVTVTTCSHFISALWIDQCSRGITQRTSTTIFDANVWTSGLDKNVILDYVIGRYIPKQPSRPEHFHLAISCRIMLQDDSDPRANAKQ